MDTASSNPHASRNLTIFGITSFLNDTASEMAYWVLPGLLISLGAGPAQLGLIEGVAEGVASGLKLWSGSLTDRLSRRKPLVVGGYAVANLAKPLLALASSWWHVFLIRFADRAAKGMRGTPRDVMITESVAKEDLGSAFGLLQTMDTAGAILGPLIALAILTRWDLKTVLYAAAIPGAVCVSVVAYFAKETKRDAHTSIDQLEDVPHHDVPQTIHVAKVAEPTVEMAPTSHTPHFSRAFYYLIFTTTLFSLAGSSDMFLILRAQEHGMALAYAPLFGLVFNITFTLFSWPAGKLSDKIQRHWIAAAGFLVYSIVYSVFAWAPSLRSLWFAMAFYGLFYALTSPVLKAMVVDAVTPETRGRAIGIYSFANSVAILFASFITGGLWKLYGGTLPLAIAAGLAFISTVLLLLYRGPKRTLAVR